MAIEAEALWVETRQQSACDGCNAKQGCGQSLLSRLGSSPTQLKVLLNGQSPEDFREGDWVEIGIAETLIVKASLLVYCVPLLTLLIGALVANNVWGGELGSIMGALVGLFIGGWVVRWHSVQHEHNPSVQPVVLSEAAVTLNWQPES
ncbi:hypothetical protein GCM10007877_22930 [Marinibactrum halimedae]|uniref:Uncharacterized protein n=1 Tax=Marinibactrum halimedae TaxID=1444977 RepID=A0AA37TCD2_9GAMM|nr:hypothetical protein GCM10007877_22930 [Marinibactrum halimedae]